MFRTCVRTFDVTDTIENFLRTKQSLRAVVAHQSPRRNFVEPFASTFNHTNILIPSIAAVECSQVHSPLGVNGSAVILTK